MTTRTKEHTTRSQRRGLIRIRPGDVAKAGLILLALWALANALWIARNVFFLVFLSVLFAILFAVAARPFRRAGLARTPAVVVAVLVLAGLANLAGWLLWPALEADLPRFREAIVPALETVIDWVEARYADVTGRPADLTAANGTSLRDGLRSALSGAWPVLSSAVGALSGLTIALFAGAYLAAEPLVYSDGLVRLAPESARPRLRSALGEAGHVLRYWLLATLFNMLTVGVLATAGLLVLGVPAALPLGVLAGLGEFVPYFGPIAMAVPAIVAGFVVSPAHALWVALFYLVLQQLQGNLITPLIMKRVVHLPPALTVLVQTLMAVLFGVFGLVLAVPALAASLVMVKETYVRRLEEEA